MKYCAICGKEMPWRSLKTYLENHEVICEDCAAEAGLRAGISYSDIDISAKDIKFKISKDREYKEFVNRESVKKYCQDHLMIDEKNNELLIGRCEYGTALFYKAKLNNILDIKYYDDNQTVEIQTQTASSGAGKAVVGGLLFGGLGAIAGGLMGRQDAHYSTKTTITKCGIQITYENGEMDELNVLLYVFMKDSISPNSETLRQAQSLITAMCEVLLPYTKKWKEKQEAEKNDARSTTTNNVEALVKAAELLDKGLLSQQEFDALKKKTLA